MGVRFDRGTVQWVGLLVSPMLALAAYGALPSEGTDGPGLTQAGRATAAVAVWMAGWWMTEAIPLYATALLPLALLPLLGAGGIREVASSYGHEMIFLFMGGFILALGLERWGLHRRIALVVLAAIGSGPRRTVAGFMGITALLSMWVSNTATAIVMLPIATSVLGRSTLPDPERSRFAVSLLLGIAYAASIGGLGTVIGSPPNLFVVSWAAQELGVEIGFARWMAIGLPVVVVFLPLAWWLLSGVLYRVPAGAAVDGDFARHELRALGPLGRGEWIVLTVFTIAATSWILRPWLPVPGLSDAGIAVAAALALFVLPVDASRRVFAMDWETAVGLPWGVLILFGGGLSLAAALEGNGVGAWLGTSVAAWTGLPDWLVIVLVISLVIALTELTSNTATTATLVPILAGIAPGLGLPPLVLVIPAGLAASCAFMLPVATPPNAVVFGSGAIQVGEMVRAGAGLNVVGVALISLLTYAVVLPVLRMMGAA